MSDIGWIFDPVPPSGAIAGGDTTSYVFRPSLDIFVREVIQNANDQRAGSAPAEVTFDFDVVEGDRRATVLAALGWEALSEHLDAVASSKNLLAGRIRQLLDHPERPIVMLFIRDLNTRGLVGDENGQDGNFGPLCRHKLVTTEDKALKGGSHGLGKAVLWSFSGVSTVGFSSVPVGDSNGARFICRAELPYHRVGQDEWAGPGWLGAEEDVPNGRRSVSVRGTAADEWISETGFTRAPDETGTTILVPFFFEPEEEQQREPEVIAEAVLESVARWFWPSLAAAKLRCEVVVRRGGKVSYRATAKADGVVAPFVAAWSDPITGDAALEADEIAQREISFSPPALREGGAATSEGGGKLLLRIRRASESEMDHDLVDSVALVRGALMVVKYFRPRNLPLGSRGFFGVLRAGTALDSSDVDEVIEDFLRSAEPPQHNDWLHNTNNIRSRYQQGSKARLTELWAAIERSTGEMCRRDAPLEDEGPKMLAKLFPVGKGVVPPPPKAKFNVRVERGDFADGVWTVQASVVRRSGVGPWRAEGAMKLEAETGAGVPLVITDVTAGSGVASWPQSGKGQFVVAVPADTDDVHITVNASAPTNETGVSKRARMRVDLRAHEEV